MTTYKQIEDFLVQKKIAMIGVSRNEKNYTRSLFKELLKRGYEAVPVNPNISEIEGRQCYTRLEEISPIPDAALIFTTSVPLDNLITECVQSGVKHIWVYNGRDKGRLMEHLEEYCRSNNVSFISGFCPFMFLSEGGFIHKFHGFVSRLTGNYPVH